MLSKPEADERVASITCPDRECRDNLFGFCQTKPDLDKTGKCKKIFRSGK